MSPSSSYQFLVILIFITVSIKYTDAIMCHRCYSAMGGCGYDVNWRMYPWRSCPDSEFCVKVMEKVGSEYKIIRECEHELDKNVRHRLMMPVLRRHGYCEPARKNDPRNPSVLTDSSIQYCFCKDWNGCNAATLLQGFTLLKLISVFLTLLLVLH
ncbi:uncharacterized protein LOC115214089 [Octopus sinensis]|uniref:Uncharacterized protein LOC115214089 n=1 Tax=Octopus sinensis TaxID=2607531 RepID=A0A6P7SM35_9MOLL|nr:uncharacterized protein LOC115214089 [Octopus sinensis]